MNRTSCPNCKSEIPHRKEAAYKDVALCLHCGSINVYDKRLQVRPASIHDLLTLSLKELKQVRAFYHNTQRLIEGVKRTTGR